MKMSREARRMELRFLKRRRCGVIEVSRFHGLLLSCLIITHGRHLALNPALSERAATGLCERFEIFIRVFATGLRELCLLLAFIFPTLWCSPWCVRSRRYEARRWRRP